MKIGDLVQIKGMENSPTMTDTLWPDCHGQVGVIVAEAMRLHIPAAKVMVLGQVAEFDLDELEVISEDR